MKTLIFLIILSLFTTNNQAQTDSEKRLKADVQFLADDLLKGRKTPSEGLDIAAHYLANQLEAYGWEPANDGSYFQKVPLLSYEFLKSKYTVVLNGKELAPEEFLLSTTNLKISTTNESDLVFLGQGIYLPEKNVDDFKDIDLDGKAGIVFYGAPWEMNSDKIQSCDRWVGKRLSVGMHKGSLIIYVTPELSATGSNTVGFEVPIMKEAFKASKVKLADENIKASEFAPVLMISPEVFDKTLAAITGKSYKQWQPRLKESTHLKSFPLNAKVSITVNTKPIKSVANNVVAYKRSNDPVLGNEWIWLTAHYDHVGISSSKEGKDSINNGADDNASGTAAILEIARKLAESNNLKRSVMISFSCGEEPGMLGSAFTTSHPLIPLDKVKLNINADMVGRYVDNLTCTTTGCEGLYMQAKKLGEKYNMNVLPDLNSEIRLVYFTDCYHFFKNDIPFIEFFTGYHSDYHQPSDDAKLINYKALDKITQLIYDFTISYINIDRTPIFTKPFGFLTSNKK